MILKSLASFLVLAYSPLVLAADFPAELARIKHEWRNIKAFSPDGRYLVSTLEDDFDHSNRHRLSDFSLRYYDTKTGEVGVWFKHSVVANSLIFSEDGRLLITSSDSELKIFDLATKTLLADLGDLKIPLSKLHISGDLLIVSTHMGEINYFYSIKDPTQPKQVFVLGERQDYDDLLVFSPDRRYLATVSLNDEIELVDLSDFRVISTRLFIESYQPFYRKKVFGPSSNLIAGKSRDSGRLAIYNIAKRTIQLGGAELPPGQSNIELSPDGSFVLVTAGKRLAIASTRNLRSFAITLKTATPVQLVHIRRDSRQILALTESSVFVIYRQDDLFFSGRLRYVKVSRDSYFNAKRTGYSPDGKHFVLTNVLSTEVKIFNSKNLEPIGQISGLGWIREVSFSPDGTKLLAIARHTPLGKSTYRQDLVVFDLQKQKEVARVMGKEGEPGDLTMTAATSSFALTHWSFKKSGEPGGRIRYSLDVFSFDQF